MRFNWVIFCDGMPFHGETYKERSLGGSETAAAGVSKALADRDHEVHMFSRCDKPGMYSGVEYHRIEDFLQWSPNVPHDITVVQRVPHPLTLPLNSSLRFFWMHDLALKRNCGPMQGIMWAVDKVLVVSEWMKRQYQSVYNYPEDIFLVTRNGIDLDLINSVPDQPRDPKLLVWTARPERGMDVLLEETFPRLLQKDPNLRLCLAGYDNYVDLLRPLYEKCHALIGRFGGRVQHLGALNKTDLYKLYKSAWLYIYPTGFHEVSCITALECMACGLPIVGSQLAALPETLDKGAGVLIPHRGEPFPTSGTESVCLYLKQGDPLPESERDPKFQEAFVSACLDLLGDKHKWEQMSLCGQTVSHKFSWDGVAEQWETVARSLLDKEEAYAVAR